MSSFSGFGTGDGRVLANPDTTSPSLRQLKTKRRLICNFRTIGLLLSLGPFFAFVHGAYLKGNNRSPQGYLMPNIKTSKPNKQALKTSTSGAALIEYGMLVGLISVLSIGAVLSLGEEVSDTFSTTKSALEFADADSESQDDAAAPPYIYGDNIINNGDATQGSSGWTTTAGTMEVRSENDDPYFRLTEDPVTIKQDFAIPENLWDAIDEDRVTYTISYRIKNSESYAAPYVFVEFFSDEERTNRTNAGSSGQTLGQWGTQGNWELKSTNAYAVKPNARWGVIEVSRVSGNQYMDFDDLSVVFNER
jgi:Flp pilus assembly pilin Flp